jgi:hypothetical protein
MSRACVLALTLGTALLGACDQPATVTPAPKPALARPVATVGASLRIPRAAVVRRGAETLVFVLDANSNARARLVRLARPAGDTVEVLAGLHGNETLVLGDLTAVHDGSPITPAKSAK